MLPTFPFNLLISRLFTMARLDDVFSTELTRIAARGGARRLRGIERLAPGRVQRDGRELIDFSSNDYLALSFAAPLRARAAQWALEYGAGAGASRLIGGTLDLHEQVEAKLAAWKRRPAALVFASGWQANVAVLAALLGRDDLVFADRLVHASLHHGVKAAGAREIRFRHNDLMHLEELLATHQARPGRRFILTESVFSMDGDCADIVAIAELAERFGAFFYLDEAHATGVLGEHGRGLADASVDLAMGTFSKAFGGFGAYVAGSRPLIDYLIHVCSGFIHTTAPPPSMLGAIDAALDLVPGMDHERAHLADLAANLRSALTEVEVNFGASTTQIVPLIFGGAEETMRIAAGLEERGILGVAIRPPTVPDGTSRIRIALSSAHSAADVEHLVATLRDISH